MTSPRREGIGPHRPGLPPGLTIVTAAGIALAAAILALHAGLLPEAHWQGDDFICAAYARDGHLRYLWEARIGGWSPRPLSETVFYAYGRLAAAAGRPFIVPFLALLWAALIASTLVTRRRGSPLARIQIGLATACMFLLGHPVAEMYFWPAGGVAYITTLAAASLALFLLIDDRTESGIGALALCASLTACAASSEAGAFAAVPLTLVLAATTGSRRSHIALLLVPPLLVAGFVFWVLAHHRMVSAEAAHHGAAWRHIAASLRPVPRALFEDFRPLWPARLLFAIGLRWNWALSAPPPRHKAALPGFAAALLLAAGATIAAGIFQFATPCCERHDSLRQGWVILAIAAVAIWSTRRPPAPRLARLGPATLLAACLLATLPRLAPIAHDFRLLPAITAANRAAWRSGRNPESDAMLFRLPPAADLAGGVPIPTGRYSEPALNSWTAHGILHFFGKQRITIEP